MGNASQDTTNEKISQTNDLATQKVFKDDFPMNPKSKLPYILPNEAFENKGVKDSFEPSFNLEDTTEEEVYEAIQNCQNIQELYGLYKAFPQFQSSLRTDFEVRKTLVTSSQN